ncbi:hypothetical protein A5787_10250 [Mycobacterium sp. 852002-50816_SCH5313054-b]|uniref:C39 family peptidase n=1 Tax=Mycobacterium sp. 852002-50816_SCH5313054-b TaxID=1834092 RepID=UPI0007FD1A88|nr:C39 family peptidase [Mycobacterium sp. 852002-50816_SCH5313054-b]OBF47551.1 hypothetical protein A5787_10250 [Mycobacterium sp. 852002-50816_SCH5313054-b]
MFGYRIEAAARAALAAACVAAACVLAGGSPAARAAGGMYGDPQAAAKYWQEQSLEDNCGLMAAADVVGEVTGAPPTERQMVKLAQNTPSGTNAGPIYAPRGDPSHTNGNGGIEMADEVVLLKHFGVKSTMFWDKQPDDRTGLPALEQYLSNNRKIIAYVNYAFIWSTSDQRKDADHFVVVTGIDTNKEMVHLNDPAAGYADTQVPISAFTNAWRAGEDSVVVTS